MSTTPYIEHVTSALKSMDAKHSERRSRYLAMVRKYADLISTPRQDLQLALNNEQVMQKDEVYLAESTCAALKEAIRTRRLGSFTQESLEDEYLRALHGFIGQEAAPQQEPVAEPPDFAAQPAQSIAEPIVPEVQSPPSASGPRIRATRLSEQYEPLPPDLDLAARAGHTQAYMKAFRIEHRLDEPELEYLVGIKERYGTAFETFSKLLRKGYDPIQIEALIEVKAGYGKGPGNVPIVTLDSLVRFRERFELECDAPTLIDAIASIEQRISAVTVTKAIREVLSQDRFETLEAYLDFIDKSRNFQRLPMPPDFGEDRPIIRDPGFGCFKCVRGMD